MDDIIKICLNKNHKSSPFSMICLNPECKEKNKFGCGFCMKELHKKCDFESILFLNELREENFKIYP